MKKYRKKPVVVEAEQFISHIPPLESMGTEATGETWHCLNVLVDEKGPFIYVHTLNGRTRAEVGDWIIYGPSGDVWPCKPDIFEQTYEEA